MTMAAIGPGQWGNNLLVRVRTATQSNANPALFRVMLLYYADGVPSPFIDPTNPANLSDPLRVEPDVLEDFDNLLADPSVTNYFVSTINSRSRLVHIPDAAPGQPNVVALPVTANHDFATANGDTSLHVIATNPGAPTLTVEVLAGTNPSTGQLKVIQTEDFDDLTPALALSAINRGSRLVSASWFQVHPPNPIVPSDPNVAAAAPLAGQLDLVTANADTDLRITARYGNKAALVTVEVKAGTLAGTFQITIVDTEIFDNLTPANLVNTVNSASDLIRVQWRRANPPRPFVSALPTIVAATPIAGGSGTLFGGGYDVTPTAASYIGDAPAVDQRTGLSALRLIDEISLLCVPDEGRDNLADQVTNAIIDQCEQLRDRFAVLSTGAGQGNVTQVAKPRDSSYGAVYYPQIRIIDPYTQMDVLIPPSGHVTGIYARTDVERGVHKAPANEVVRGIVTRDITADRRSLEFTLSKGQHDILNPRGINVIRDFRAHGRDIRVWGARTMSSDSQWKYVNVRRLFIFVEESIDKGTQWVVFEPNDETTWSAVVRSITGFLTTVWRSGALMGTSAAQAFFVKCDRTTMSQDEIDGGKLICLIGIAPVKPAEFVIFRISQKTAEAES
jgi:phage tail sheath protein FI